ncbi:MAG: hypothetical protein PF961_21420 [Planctomycetota bacterium]|nr:hypothetical protein [Planctomycetota bacterium]
MQIARVGSVLPGAELTVKAVVIAKPGYQTPVEIAAALQLDAPTNWTTGTLSDEAWTWTVTVPEGEGWRVGVRLRDADGNSVESGFEDFAMKP